MRVAFLGATKGMGRALARLMAARGDALFLLGRDQEQLARSARDLEVTGAPPPVGFVRCDLSEPIGFAPALDAAVGSLGALDAVVVTAGVFATQEELELDFALRDRLLRVDYVNTVHFCEEARARLLPAGGTLCVFSSVAGDRARKPTLLYGSAKAGLTAYLDGLDVRFRDKGLKTVLVKPGFVKTGMTERLDPPPFSGEPGDVARTVLAAIDKGRPVVYAPPIWRWVMFVVKRLPRAFMRRAKF